MRNSNDTIGKQTRDLPTSSAVPQPTSLPRAPPIRDIELYKHVNECVNIEGCICQRVTGIVYLKFFILLQFLSQNFSDTCFCVTEIMKICYVFCYAILIQATRNLIN